MYYRLVAIDACALPAPMMIGDRQHRIAHGGLLLEPPREGVHHSPDGHGIIKFFGALEGDAVAFIASSSESYRWLAPGMLDFSRPGSAHTPRFSGIAALDRLELVAESDGSFVRAGTRLELLASPTSPIPPDWTSTFDYGPPSIQPVEPERRTDPVVLALIRESILAGEPSRLHAVALRLEAAWRAPA